MILLATKSTATDDDVSATISSYTLRALCLDMSEASTSPTSETNNNIATLICTFGKDSKSKKMKFTTLTSALALFAASASALDKPLDIQVDKAVECTRKTTAGECSTLHQDGSTQTLMVAMNR